MGSGYLPEDGCNQHAEVVADRISYNSYNQPWNDYKPVLEGLSYRRNKGMARSISTVVSVS